MNKTVKIACDEQGQYSVGLEAPAGSSAMLEGTTPGAPPEEAMEPAASLDDALAKAKALFQEPVSADGGPSPFEKGFTRARGTPMPGGM